jgi:hypothetical protein
MTNWLRANAVLALGIALPLLLLIVFATIRQIKTGQTAPPLHAVVFIQHPHYPADSYSFQVTDNRLSVTYEEPEKKPARPPDLDPVRIYKFDPVSEKITEFKLTRPTKIHTHHKVELILPPELASLRLDPSAESPDGYRFTRTNYNDGNLITAVFGYDGNNRFQITNGTRHIRLPPTGSLYGQEQLIGWVLKP